MQGTPSSRASLGSWLWPGATFLLVAAALLQLHLGSSTVTRLVALGAGLGAAAAAALLLRASVLRVQQLEEAERRLRESQRIARIGSWEHDVQRGTFTWSEEMFRIFGRDPSLPVPPLEERLAQVDSAADRDRVDGIIREVLATGRLDPFEYRIVLPTGDRRTIHVEGMVRERDPSGRPTRIAGTCQDVTERRLIEDAARRMEVRILELRRMEALGTLAGGIAHDFNNILMAILGNAQLAVAKIPPGTPGRENLQPVLTSGQRAKELVAQILDFSRVDPVRREPVDVGAIVQEAAEFLRPVLPAGVRLKLDVPPEPIRAVASGTQIYQVLVNLGTNAVHSMKERGGEVRLGLRAVHVEGEDVRRHPQLEKGPHAEITVSDDGHGIAAPVRARIFDPFFTTKEVGQGTGMGLAVVWGIIASHGGAIDVDSEPDRGSTFRVLLPIGQRLADVESPAPA
ncbi:MAG: ATP-binding protein [bacterium]